jgi:hypothetical protein
MSDTIGDAWSRKFRVDPRRRACLSFATDGLGSDSVPIQIGVRIGGETGLWYVTGGDPRRNADITRILSDEYNSKALAVDDAVGELAAFMAKRGDPQLILLNSLKWNKKTLPVMLPRLWALLKGRALIGLGDAVCAYKHDGFELSESPTLQAGADKAASLFAGLPGYSKRRLRELCEEAGVEAAIVRSEEFRPWATLCESTLLRLDALYEAHLAEPLKL